MAGKIFISYRREDAPGSAALIHDSLARAFGAANVFMDVDNLLAGQRFEHELERAIAGCQIFIAVIGPRWLDLLTARRASRERDYVREEIATALNRRVVVIPVTVERGGLPRGKDLPDDIRDLVSHHQQVIGPESRHRDTEALVSAVRASWKKSSGAGTIPWKLLAAGAAAFVSAVAVALVLSNQSAQTPPNKIVSQLSKPSPTATQPVPQAETHKATFSTIAPKDNPSDVVPGSGQSFRDNSTDGRPCPQCPEMIVVPPGKFTMGSPQNEPERDAAVEGEVGINIGYPLAVGKHAVTFDEWDACVADGGCNGYKPPDEGWGRGQRPVINVSWDQISWYIAWLKAKTGKHYRLLSESEREYVTRAGSTSTFWWGSSITPLQANYDGAISFPGGGVGEFRGKTVLAQSLQPNPWGLYNVHGNVWEWTDDCWHNDNTTNPRDGNADTAWADCDRRVLRGGAWDSDPKFLRAAARTRSVKDVPARDVGFRVARKL